MHNGLLGSAHASFEAFVFDTVLHHVIGALLARQLGARLGRLPVRRIRRARVLLHSKYIDPIIWFWLTLFDELGRMHEQGINQ